MVPMVPQEVPVATYDGRAFLQAVDRKYDVILVDAYQDITIPFQMASVEFFTLVREHLNEDGVMVVNMNMRGEEDSINQYLADTIASVFPGVWTVDVRGGTNRELFASLETDLPEKLAQNLPLCGDPSLQDMMLRVSGNLVPYQAGGRVMTDDRAPVELLSMRVMDQLIGSELSYYRALYDEQGIRGLLANISF